MIAVILSALLLWGLANAKTLEGEEQHAEDHPDAGHSRKR